ncbi:type II toxin-antitoxin system Phd/YefM family antitoxin [Mesorhizobium sp. W016]
MNVSITEAKAKLSELVGRAEAGEEIVITRHGKIAARLVAPVREDLVSRIGALKGKIWILTISTNSALNGTSTPDKGQRPSRSTSSFLTFKS